MNKKVNWKKIVKIKKKKYSGLGYVDASRYEFSKYLMLVMILIITELTNLKGIDKNRQINQKV